MCSVTPCFHITLCSLLTHLPLSLSLLCELDLARRNHFPPWCNPSNPIPGDFPTSDDSALNYKERMFCDYSFYLFKQERFNKPSESRGGQENPLLWMNGSSGLQYMTWVKRKANNTPHSGECLRPLCASAMGSSQPACNLRGGRKQLSRLLYYRSSCFLSQGTDLNKHTQAQTTTQRVRGKFSFYARLGDNSSTKSSLSGCFGCSLLGDQLMYWTKVCGSAGIKKFGKKMS